MDTTCVALRRLIEQLETNLARERRRLLATALEAYHLTGWHEVDVIARLEVEAIRNCLWNRHLELRGDLTRAPSVTYAQATSMPA